MSDTSNQSAQERVARYREIAAEMERLSTISKNSEKAGYRALAEQWNKLADELEKTER
jgi:hypothetical protein